MTKEYVIAITVDATGTRCPIPLLRFKQASKKIKAGECVELLATDPSTRSDLEAMLKHLPHRLVESAILDAKGSLERFVILKGELGSSA